MELRKEYMNVANNRMTVYIENGFPENKFKSEISLGGESLVWRWSLVMRKSRQEEERKRLTNKILKEG